MSAFSTLHITRNKAKELYIQEKLKLQISDRELEDFLDDYLEPRLYNAIIIDNYDTDQPNDDWIL